MFAQHLRRSLALSLALAVAACSGGTGQSELGGPPSPTDDDPSAGESRMESTRVYYVYVGAESADLMHRVRFGPGGAAVDRTTPVGEMAVENEGPHGFNLSPDGKYLYMSTGHGVPTGKLWKFAAGPDTLVAPPVALGRFPATLDLTPDGLYAFVVNFNLHGEMVPSTISVVFTPEMIEVERIETCTMPHGARMSPNGLRLYSGCMMDDQLVEVDTRSFGVSRRFSVTKGAEGPIQEMAGHGPPSMDMEHGVGHAPTCSPTWTEPSVDGSKIYVACNKGDEILEIGVKEWKLLRKFATGPAPYNLAASPDGRLLAATLKKGGAVEFFDLASGESLARTPTSTTVTHGVVISPDSRYAFVTVEGVGAEPGKVDIFDLGSFERVADVEVGQQAGGITFWKMEEMP